MKQTKTELDVMHFLYYHPWAAVLETASVPADYVEALRSEVTYREGFWVRWAKFCAGRRRERPAT